MWILPNGWSPCVQIVLLKVFLHLYMLYMWCWCPLQTLSADFVSLLKVCLTTSPSDRWKHHLLLLLLNCVQLFVESLLLCIVSLCDVRYLTLSSSVIIQQFLCLTVYYWDFSTDSLCYRVLVFIALPVCISVLHFSWLIAVIF